jgi:hypothetical protein
MTYDAINGSITLTGVNKKLVEVIEQLLMIQKKSIKCSVSLDFSGNAEVFIFRYTNINPIELHEMILELHNNKAEREKSNVGSIHQSTGRD